MTNDEIEKLRKVLKRIRRNIDETYHGPSARLHHLSDKRLMWMPDHNTAHEVKTIGTHPEEGDDTPCAIFWDGKYVALYNCDLETFSIAECLR